MDNQPDTIQQDNQPKLMPKTLEAFKLVEAGLHPKEALQAVNYTSKISPQSVSSFKNKLKKYSLTHPSTVKAAKNQITRILSGEGREERHTKVCKDGQVVEYKDNIYPSDTNILAAASMVYDRFEPVINKSQNLNVNVDVSPVDLSLFRNAQLNQGDK